jgi:LPS O-antigen subunit length determinant protein (WzzB/FepE family)
MQEHNVSPPPANASYAIDDDEIDIRSLLTRFWRDRRLILIGTIVITLLALTTNEVLSKYKSEGFFSVSGITPVNYKKYQSVILNAENFQAYASEIGMADGDLKQSLNFLVSDKPEQFAKVATMVSPVTPKDVKEFVLGTDKKESVFLGMTVSTSANDPTFARDMNMAVSQYIRDSVMRTDLTDWVRSVAANREAEVAALKNKTIQTNRAIEEAEKKLDALKMVVKRIPEAATMHSRQVLSAESGAEKFMSPVAQMVVAETSIVDARLSLKTLTRQQKQMDAAYLFYKPAADLANKATSGQKLFEELLALQSTVFQNINLDDDALGEVVNNVNIELESSKRRYFQEFRYISGPTLPTKLDRAGLALVTAGAAAAGMLLMLMASLVLAWWRQDDDAATLPKS